LGHHDGGSSRGVWRGVMRLECPDGDEDEEAKDKEDQDGTDGV
jgi:hypothetical protein